MVWFKPKLLGSSRSDDDGNEKICLDPLNLLNEGNFFFPGVESLLRVVSRFRKGKFVDMYSRPS